MRKNKVRKQRETKCPVCHEVSCGDDFHTVTPYVNAEKRCGDRLKVILLQVYDMAGIDNLQKAEIKALINCLIDEHINEIDLNDEE